MELKAVVSIDSSADLHSWCESLCGNGSRLQGTQIKQARPSMSGEVQHESAPVPVVSGEDLAAGRSFRPVAGSSGPYSLPNQNHAQRAGAESGLHQDF